MKKANWLQSSLGAILGTAIVFIGAIYLSLKLSNSNIVSVVFFLWGLALTLIYTYWILTEKEEKPSEEEDNGASTEEASQLQEHNKQIRSMLLISIIVSIPLFLFWKFNHGIWEWKATMLHPKTELLGTNDGYSDGYYNVNDRGIKTVTKQVTDTVNNLDMTVQEEPVYYKNNEGLWKVTNENGRSMLMYYTESTDVRLPGFAIASRNYEDVAGITNVNMVYMMDEIYDSLLEILNRADIGEYKLSNTISTFSRLEEPLVHHFIIDYERQLEARGIEEDTGLEDYVPYKAENKTYAGQLYIDALFPYNSIRTDLLNSACIDTGNKKDHAKAYLPNSKEALLEYYHIGEPRASLYDKTTDTYDYHYLPFLCRVNDGEDNVGTDDFVNKIFIKTDVASYDEFFKEAKGIGAKLSEAGLFGEWCLIGCKELPENTDDVIVSVDNDSNEAFINQNSDEYYLSFYTYGLDSIAQEYDAKTNESWWCNVDFAIQWNDRVLMCSPNIFD